MRNNRRRRILLGWLLWSSIVAPSIAATVDVWVGNTGPEGIYHVTFDTDSGQLGDARLVGPMQGPGFLATHPNGRVIYAVGSYEQQPSVVAFAIQQDDAGAPTLRAMNAQPIGDGGATHVCVDGQGQAVFTAQYGGGSVAMFPLDPNGRLLPRQQLVEHQGGSRVVPGRQESPHPHWVGLSPDQQFLFVPDLGLDQVVVYRLQREPLQLIAHTTAPMPAGGGPRHMKFHPNARWAYVLNELTLAVTVCEFAADRGALTPIQTIPTLSEEEKSGENFNSASEIRVHPTGRFVYTANRGHDSISVFRVADDGRLTRVEVEPVRGAWPRNFAIDPTGAWLLAAGRDTHSLAAFEIDPTTGKLRHVTHGVAQVTSPICVLFAD